MGDPRQRIDIELDAVEVRVLGCLIEKETTTPDNYPLSLNAITTAANQKTNREPVMQLSEAEVQAAVDSLVRYTLVGSRSGAGSRVIKYAHRLSDRLGDEFLFSQAELGALAVLFLRGPQTAGEVRARGARLHQLSDVGDVITLLEALGSRDAGICVARLHAAPGQKESRYAHLFSGEAPEPVATGPAPMPGAAPSGGGGALAGRVEALETEVSELKAIVQRLREQLGDT